jgi:hypothetical protein
MLISVKGKEIVHPVQAIEEEVWDDGDGRGKNEYEEEAR